MACKTYHTMEKTELAGVLNLFHPQHGSHYIDLPNGRILLAASFLTEGAEEAFGLQVKSLQSLPHPIFSGSDKISVGHVEELSHLFTSKEEARSATVRDVVKKATAIHPLMRLSAF